MMRLDIGLGLGPGIAAQESRPRPPKSRDAILLDRLHGIRIAAKRLVEGLGDKAELKVELDAFDLADMRTRG